MVTSLIQTFAHMLLYFPFELLDRGGAGGGGEWGEFSIAILTLTSPINFNMPTKSVLVLETKGSFVLLFHSHTSLSERDHIDHDTFYYYFFHFFLKLKLQKA